MGCDNFHTVIHKEKGVCSFGKEKVYFSNTSKEKEVVVTIKVGQSNNYDNPKFFSTHLVRLFPGEKESVEVWCGEKMSVIGEK